MFDFNFGQAWMWLRSKMTQNCYVGVVTTFNDVITSRYLSSDQLSLTKLSQCDLVLHRCKMCWQVIKDVSDAVVLWVCGARIQTVTQMRSLLFISLNRLPTADRLTEQDELILLMIWINNNSGGNTAYYKQGLNSGYNSINISVGPFYLLKPACSRHVHRFKHKIHDQSNKP